VLLDAGADPTILCENAGDEFGGTGSGRGWFSSEPQDETKGYTALHALCASGQQSHGTDKSVYDTHQNLFALLLENGAKVSQGTYADSTALHAAVNNPVLVRQLLNAGADTNVSENRGRAPLHMVTSPELVRLLVEDGQADVNKAYPYDGCTPLLSMLQGYHTEVILKLLNYRPDLSLGDKKGNGALQIALMHHGTSLPVMEELLAVTVLKRHCCW
jgi:ankyrin repeat protein